MKSHEIRYGSLKIIFTYERDRGPYSSTMFENRLKKCVKKCWVPEELKGLTEKQLVDKIGTDWKGMVYFNSWPMISGRRFVGKVGFTNEEDFFRFTLMF